jgi:Ca2+-binding RTX toxin-like protein
MAFIQGDAGDNELFGDTDAFNNDVILGLDGDDRLFGLSGNDSIQGGKNLTDSGFGVTNEKLAILFGAPALTAANFA